jgi:flagellar biosynthesis/type III secretory pathway protein FliH
MSDRPIRGTLRIVSGGETARVLVETGGHGHRAPVPDAGAMALERAREEGFQAGVIAARAESVAREKELTETIARLAEQLPGAWEDQLARFEETLRESFSELAFQVVECLARSPLLATEAVRSAVYEALSLPLGEGPIVVRCHPADAEALAQTPDHGVPQRLRFVPDPRMEPGDAWIETAETGDLDGRLAGRLQILREHLEAMVIELSAES